MTLSVTSYGSDLYTWWLKVIYWTQTIVKTYHGFKSYRTKTIYRGVINMTVIIGLLKMLIYKKFCQKFIRIQTNGAKSYTHLKAAIFSCLSYISVFNVNAI